MFCLSFVVTAGPLSRPLGHSFEGRGTACDTGGIAVTAGLLVGQTGHSSGSSGGSGGGIGGGIGHVAEASKGHTDGVCGAAHDICGGGSGGGVGHAAEGHSAEGPAAGVRGVVCAGGSDGGGYMNCGHPNH